MNDVLSTVRSRFTTKHYNPERRISDEDFAKLMEVLRLAPSSVNSQPWHFFISDNAESRAKILPAFPEFNRDRVKDASHVIVFAVPTELTEQYYVDLLDQEAADGRFDTIPTGKTGQDAGRRHFAGLHSTSPEEFYSWACRQAYIALGFILYAAGEMGISTTPLEGLDYPQLDEILGFKEKGYRTAICLSLGYGHEDDSNASRPKSRWPAERIFTTL